MKTAAFAMTLLIGAAALAPVPAAAIPYAGDGAATAAWETDAGTAQDTTAQDATMATPTIVTTAASDAVVQPSNANPERDARGIAVISDPATVPAGYNGTPDALNGTGGPLLDTAGEPAATPDAAYPACTRTVTDNCVQRYERQGR